MSETADMTESSGKQNGFSSTAALVAYLRNEADLAEKKAKRLRDQAASLAQQFGITGADQIAYGERFAVFFAE